MFVSCIDTLSDDDQRAKWLPMAKDYKMLGCYAQTELGHGSNVAVSFSSNDFIFVGCWDYSYIW